MLIYYMIIHFVSNNDSPDQSHIEHILVLVFNNLVVYLFILLFHLYFSVCSHSNEMIHRSYVGSRLVMFVNSPTLH